MRLRCIVLNRGLINKTFYNLYNRVRRENLRALEWPVDVDLHELISWWDVVHWLIWRHWEIWIFVFECPPGHFVIVQLKTYQALYQLSLVLNVAHRLNAFEKWRFVVQFAGNNCSVAHSQWNQAVRDGSLPWQHWKEFDSNGGTCSGVLVIARMCWYEWRECHDDSASDHSQTGFVFCARLVNDRGVNFTFNLLQVGLE